MTYPYTADVARIRAEVRRELRHGFAPIEALLTFADPVLDAWGRRRGTPPLTQYTGSLLALLGRASHTAHAIVVLSEHLFSNIAMMATRQLFETMLSAYWMSAVPKLRAAQFADFASFERVKFAELISELEMVDGPVPLPTHLQDPREVRKVCNRFAIVRNGWTRLGSKRLVQDVAARWPKSGVGELLMHAKMAGLLGSRHAHAGAEDTGAHLTETQTGWQVSLGPPDNATTWAEIALMVSAWTYGQLFDLCVTELQLTDIARWRVHFRSALFRRVAVTTAEAAGLRAKDVCICGSGLPFRRCHRERLDP